MEYCLLPGDMIPILLQLLSHKFGLYKIWINETSFWSRRFLVFFSKKRLESASRFIAKNYWQLLWVVTFVNIIPLVIAFIRKTALMFKNPWKAIYLSRQIRKTETPYYLWDKMSWYQFKIFIKTIYLRNQETILRILISIWFWLWAFHDFIYFCSKLPVLLFCRKWW